MHGMGVHIDTGLTVMIGFKLIWVQIYSLSFCFHLELPLKPRPFLPGKCRKQGGRVELK